MLIFFQNLIADLLRGRIPFGRGRYKSLSPAEVRPRSRIQQGPFRLCCVIWGHKKRRSCSPCIGIEERRACFAIKTYVLVVKKIINPNSRSVVDAFTIAFLAAESVLSFTYFVKSEAKK